MAHTKCCRIDVSWITNSICSICCGFFRVHKNWVAFDRVKEQFLTSHIILSAFNFSSILSSQRNHFRIMQIGKKIVRQQPEQFLHAANTKYIFPNFLLDKLFLIVIWIHFYFKLKCCLICVQRCRSMRNRERMGEKKKGGREITAQQLPASHNFSCIVLFYCIEARRKMNDKLAKTPVIYRYKLRFVVSELIEWSAIKRV